MAKGLAAGGMKKGSLRVEKSLLLFSHSVVSDSLQPMDCSMPGFPILHYTLLKLMSVESVMLSNHLILCHLLLLPSIFPSIVVFPKESALCIRWPNYWSFSISPSNKYSGLISLRIDWFDLLAVPGTLKSLLQHHSLKASVLRCSAFFMVQLSHLFVTPWMAARQASLSFTISWSLLKFMFTELVMPPHHLISGCHLTLPPPSFAFSLSQL